ncbi:archaetidylserine decarboxylase [Vulgatibacter incomptus]|uniref:Phosphatidylserine decarboxylase proenzyme n=1 Tax=Vulgatibacter incomptus TaxID=1391653 RepID=A0A0K1PDC4_9BACT|nr:archaetidylserine decarboxylase [Vulgatibacter incomptus]AKU91543.1 Phosphatidylserine decarboxylase [Vulgatibacter incomptus]
MRDAAFLAFVKLLPKKPLSRLVGTATRVDGLQGAHQAAIRTFCKQYDVAVDEAELPLEAYPSFGAFFTRKLKPGLRPIAPGERVPVSPVDGAVSQAGVAEAGRLIQAKGRDYSLAALLGDSEEAERFAGGAYATLYLSPRDYHRIHAPLDGTILGYRYVPGHLWPVNRPSVRGVPELFAVNERVIIWMDTPVGRVAVIAVGATCVGRIRLSFDDLVTNSGGPPSRVRYDLPRPIAKGAELGMFEMGSTVILVFEPGKVALDSSLVPDAPVRLGQAIGHSIG